MSIWFRPFTVDDLNQRSKNTLADHLGIAFTSIGEDSLTAIMPVTSSIKQPLGIVHGGANVVLAETVASTAANVVVDIERFYCVGLEINANHIRPATEGILTCIARAIHIGRTTQVWHIDIYNDAGKQTCVSRMTASVVPRNNVGR